MAEAEAETETETARLAAHPHALALTHAPCAFLASDPVETAPSERTSSGNPVARIRHDHATGSSSTATVLHARRVRPRAAPRHRTLSARSPPFRRRGRLRRVAQLVQDLCKKHDLQYSFSSWDANRRTLATLRATALQARDLANPSPRNLLWEAVNTHG
uniref:Uncharacterized protein n=1 Tax=Ananas comosus var. bracteatus TaxID=296719 RepID=A0A6V7NVW7_ANACO|nr:unnamed protein product [Ananas comosus var. bracteatus]